MESENMRIRVLAVGPHDIEKLLQNVGMEFPELKIHYATYHNEEDVVEIVKDHVTEYDLLLFAGSLPFKITTKNLKLPQAKFYIPFEGTSLYRALFQLALTGNHDLQNGTLGISVDHLQKYEVEESLEELECKVREIYYYTSYDVYDINHTVQFHYDLWKNGRIDIAITCVGLVYNRLLELGVPAVRVLPTRSAVRSTLQLVLAEGLKIKNQNSQIAIGIIDLSELFNQKDLIEYQLQRKLLMIKQSVLDYGETTNAIIKWNDRREIRLITTRGKLRLEDRQNANEWRLINDIFRKTAIKVHLGIGIGRTTNEAEMHALAALKKTNVIQADYVIIDVNGKIYGPADDSGFISYSLRSKNEKILSLAKKANISISTINRILAFFNVHEKNSVTANELAIGLGISSRSARRILHKLEQAGLVAITGEEQPVHRGRPRYVYSIQFDHW